MAQSTSATPNTRRQILDLAEDLLQDRGFNGFSYRHVAEALGVKNAAIHYHFPTKEELGCAVIQRYRDRFQLWTNNARVKNLSPTEKLDWFFNIYLNLCKDEGKVCLAGTLEAEFNAIPPQLRRQTKALTAELLAWLETTLAEGREAGLFFYKDEPAAKATLILASLQGVLQIARAVGREKVADVIRQHKNDLLANDLSA